MPFLWPPAPASQKMGGSSAMEKLLEAQQQQLDDITSESSFLEFLRNEQSCLGAVISGDCAGSTGRNSSGEDVDVDRIFAQVSKLTGEVEDERSVDEILLEAEQLIRKQPIFRKLDENGVGPYEADQPSIHTVTSAMKDISCESTPMEMRCGVLEELEAITRREEDSKELIKLALHQNAPQDPAERETTRRRSFVISTTEQQDDQAYRRPHSDQTYTLPEPAPTVPTDIMRTKRTSASSTTKPATASARVKSATPKKRSNNTNRPSSSIPRKSVEENKENQLLSQARIRDLEEIYNLTLKDTSLERKTPSPPAVLATLSREKTFCDKSTAPSPTHTAPITSSESFSWAKERELESNISELQEKLKDTEERYESLKIQYDTLSQVHRTLRENHGVIQEESDKLKLDVQHLTECANVLRSELQAARSDRDAALDLQKILQSELEESRRDKKRYQELNEKDTKTIQDLQRQCREMERILMRKHPDSVSALIVASKHSPSSKPAEDASLTRRLLEQRIAQLEADAKEQDAKAQGILANVQARFNSVQAKYETHIADLEMQVLSLQEINSKLNEKIIRQMEELSSITSHAASSLTRGAAASSNCFTQTDDIAEKDNIKTRSISVQTDNKLTGGGQPGRAQSATGGTKRVSSAGAGGKIPNSLSDSQIQNREDAHLLATIRGMRVDLAIKEKAVQRLTREVEDSKKTIKKLQKERDAYLKSDGKMAIVKGKVYDPSQYSDGITSDTGALKDAHLKIKLLEADYKTLHEKRLQDLKTLQAAHERELSACHESVRILQQRLAEREELSHAKEKRRPNHNIDYFALKAKVSSLERRHTEREQRLHMLVEALSKGGKLNGVHIRALTAGGCGGGAHGASNTVTVAAAASMNSTGSATRGDEENCSPITALSVSAHQQPLNAATVAGNL
ncbi:centrosomal protein of 162 kDa [Sabethes cyaneus]|uniref:centrosomal protein of 162 kDa n=1 Tax=Sabethes cyaneus TaxID=53552 RepID=UPI00237D825F|nr:centrosomal protein of 162 kDa [Sabethes cyaneus]